MRKPVIIFGLVLLLPIAIAAWQVTASYIANAELQSDLTDLTVQNGARIGLFQVDSADELRDAVISRARDHGIQLAPEQVTVYRTIEDKMLRISLAVDYAAPINILGYRSAVHFSPSSSHSEEIVAK